MCRAVTASLGEPPRGNAHPWPLCKLTAWRDCVRVTKGRTQEINPKWALLILEKEGKSWNRAVGTQTSRPFERCLAVWSQVTRGWICALMDFVHWHGGVLIKKKRFRCTKSFLFFPPSAVTAQMSHVCDRSGSVVWIGRAGALSLPLCPRVLRVLRKAQRIVEGLNWLRVAVVTGRFGAGRRSPNTSSKLCAACV